MKYMELKGNQVLSNPDFTSGMLPDPLLPFETAVEYKEDVIAKGNNQSIYFDVETNESTPSGLYQGVVTVKTDKDTYQMLIFDCAKDIRDIADLVYMMRAMKKCFPEEMA